MIDQRLQSSSIGMGATSLDQNPVGIQQASVDSHFLTVGGQLLPQAIVGGVVGGSGGPRTRMETVLEFAGTTDGLEKETLGQVGTVTTGFGY